MQKLAEAVTDAAIAISGARFGAFFYNILDERGESYMLYALSYYGLPECDLPVTSYLAVPVISRSGEVCGGVFFGHPDKGIFSARVARIVDGLAAQAAIAMDNARLFEAAQRARGEAERAASENQQLYRRAEESSSLKEEFLATISPELRNPLNAILGWSRMLRAGQIPEEGVSKALDTIERNARAQAQLIDDLLDVSRIICRQAPDGRPSGRSEPFH